MGWAKGQERGGGQGGLERRREASRDQRESAQVAQVRWGECGLCDRRPVITAGFGTVSSDRRQREPASEG